MMPKTIDGKIRYGTKHWILKYTADNETHMAEIKEQISRLLEGLENDRMSRKTYEEKLGKYSKKTLIATCLSAGAAIAALAISATALILSA